MLASFTMTTTDSVQSDTLTITTYSNIRHSIQHLREHEQKDRNIHMNINANAGGGSGEMEGVYAEGMSPKSGYMAHLVVWSYVFNMWLQRNFSVCLYNLKAFYC